VTTRPLPDSLSRSNRCCSPSPPPGGAVLQPNHTSPRFASGGKVRRIVTEKSIQRISVEDQRLLDAQAARIDQRGPYDRHDPTFWVPHQQDRGRMVSFDTLTATVDEIIARCGYPESERERLVRDHRDAAARFLQHYEGPIEGPVPLLGDNPLAVA